MCGFMVKERGSRAGGGKVKGIKICIGSDHIEKGGWSSLGFM